MQKEVYYQYKSKLNKQIIKLCHSLELPLHYNKRGPKIYTNYQRVALIILFLRSRKSLRDFISELYESRWPIWLDLKEIPGKSTLNDWMKMFDLSFIRGLLQESTRETEPEVMAIDATGIDSWRRSRHYERRIGESFMPYSKADIIIDTETKLIHDHVLRMKPRHDVIGAKTILKRMNEEDTLILADKAYDAENLHELARENKNELYAPVRDSPRNRPRGRFRRQCFDSPPDEKGQRSIVESVMRSLKTKITELRSKIHYMKKREFAWHILVYNLEIISGEMSIIIRIFVKVFRTKPLKHNIFIIKMFLFYYGI